MTKNTGGNLGGKSGTGKPTGGAARGSSATAAPPVGLQESSGEFRVGEKIVFGMRNGNVLIRHSPQGDEVEVGEATLAGLLIDVFFTDKFGGKDGDYPPVNKQG